MSIFTSTIDYLLHQRDPVEHKFARSLARLKASSNLDHLSVLDGDSGSVSKYVHMESESALQMTSRNTYQKAMTYMQFQEEGIKYANILYSEMAKLALQATDPDISDSQRSILANQFEELKEIALDLNHSTFSDNYLFDERATTTDFSEQANWDLYWKRHQAYKPDGIIDIANSSFGGQYVEDGDVAEEIQESIYNSALTGASATGDINNEGRMITRDVIYNEGEIQILYNPGNRGEVFEIIQGDPNGAHRLLFSSGDVKTKGEAYNFDFSGLTIEYGPDKPTKVTLKDDGSESYWYYPGGAIPYWMEKPGEMEGFTDLSDQFGNSLWSEENLNHEKTNDWDTDDLLWQNGKYDWVRGNPNLINALYNKNGEQFAEEWDASMEYAQGDKVKVTNDGSVRFYEAKEKVTGGAGPSADPANWEEDLVSPALFVSRDLYKHIGLLADDKNDNESFNLDDRSAVYRLGGLEFTSKNPYIVNDRASAGDGGADDFTDAAADFTHESANKYSFEIQTADLQDKQTGTIAYGYFDVADPAEKSGFNFTPEVLFKLNPDFIDEANSGDFSGFDGNQALISFNAPSDDNDSFKTVSERNNDESWLQNLGYAANVNVGEAVEGGATLKAHVGMTLGSNKMKANFLDPATNAILGENGNGIKVIVEEESGVADRVEQSGGDTVRIILEKVLKYGASDDATINDSSLNIVDEKRPEERARIYGLVDDNENYASVILDPLSTPGTMKVTSKLQASQGNGHQIIISEEDEHANFIKASVEVGGATITSTEQGTLGNGKKITITENNFAQINDPRLKATSRQNGEDGNGDTINISVKSPLDGIHEVTKTGDQLNILLGLSISQLSDNATLRNELQSFVNGHADNDLFTVTFDDNLGAGDFTASGGGNLEDNTDPDHLVIKTGGTTIEDRDFIETTLAANGYDLSAGDITASTFTLAGGSDVFASGGESDDTSMTVTVRTGQIDAEKSTIRSLINDSDLFDAEAGTIEAGTYTLDGGEGMVVESKLRGDDGDGSQVIVNTIAGSSEVNIVEDTLNLTLTINRGEFASDDDVADKINTSSLFEVISVGKTDDDTYTAAGGEHTHTVYNYTTDDIATLLNGFHTANRNDALLRDATGSADAFFDATLLEDDEITPKEYITDGGTNEELIKYTEAGPIGTFTLSREIKGSYDDAEEDLKGGYTKQLLVDAWNGSDDNRAKISADITAISKQEGAAGNGGKIFVFEDAGAFSINETGSNLEISLEKKIDDYDENELSSIISEINSNNDLFEITSTQLVVGEYTAEGGGDWNGTGGLISKITDHNGGTDFTKTLDVKTDGGAYTTYSAESADRTHKMENLNSWLGRDREEVTYEEDTENNKVIIKLGKDANGAQITEIDPYKVADAYYAFINNKYLAEDDGHTKVDMSQFMAPVVVDSSGTITTTSKLEQWVLGKNGSTPITSNGEYEFNPATEKIAKSNEITVRVKTGDRTAYEHDKEDSFQLIVNYRPPEEKDDLSVGDGGDFNIPILSLALGLLRDDQKTEFDVGGLHLESESAGEYTLRIETRQDSTSFQESGNELHLSVDSFAEDVAGLVSAINSDKFTASGTGSLEIDQVEWNVGGLKIEGTLPGSSNPGDFDEALEILAHPEWDPEIPWFEGEKVKVTNDTDGSVKYYLAIQDIDDDATSPDLNGAEWVVTDDAPIVTDWSGNLQIYIGDPTTITAEDIIAVKDEFDLANFDITVSGSGSLDLPSEPIKTGWADFFYEEGATAVFTTSGHYGEALNLNDADSAQRAFENISREISELAGQVDKLTQNMSKVSLAEDHVGRQIAIRKDIGPNVTEEVLQEESIRLKELEILRNYHISLLHKVMRVNEDMVRMLVL